MQKNLYYHKTSGGAEYLTDRWIRNPDGSKEGAVKNARIVVRIDGDIRRDAEITINDEIAKPKGAGQGREARPESVCSDSDRLDWLMRNVSGAEFRRLGISHSAGCARADVDRVMPALTGG